MRTATLSIFCLLLLNGITSNAQVYPLRGKVVRNSSGVVIADAIVQISYKDRQVFTDARGFFRFDSLPAGVYNLKVIAAGYPLKEITVHIEKVVPAALLLEMAPPCAYDAHRKDKTCPVCQRKDLVVPIRWGLPVDKPDTARYYYAGCVITLCDPTWYCKRDDKRF